MKGPPLGLGGEDITWPDQVAPRGRKACSTRKIKPQTSNLPRAAGWRGGRGGGVALRLPAALLRFLGAFLRWLRGGGLKVSGRGPPAAVGAAPRAPPCSLVAPRGWPLAVGGWTGGWAPIPGAGALRRGTPGRWPALPSRPPSGHWAPGCRLGLRPRSPRSPRGRRLVAWHRWGGEGRGAAGAGGGGRGLRLVVSAVRVSGTAVSCASACPCPSTSARPGAALVLSLCGQQGVRGRAQGRGVWACWGGAPGRWSAPTPRVGCLGSGAQPAGHRAIAAGRGRHLRLRSRRGWGCGGCGFFGRYRQWVRAVRRARGSQLLAFAPVTRSTAPPSQKAGHVGPRSGHSARITARRTPSCSSRATHPPGGTSRFPPSLRRSRASRGWFLSPLVVAEVAQLSHPYNSITRGRASPPRGSGIASQSRAQSGRAPSAPRACSAHGSCACCAGAAPDPAPLRQWPSAPVLPLALLPRGRGRAGRRCAGGGLAGRGAGGVGGGSGPPCWGRCCRGTGGGTGGMHGTAWTSGFGGAQPPLPRLRSALPSLPPCPVLPAPGGPCHPSPPCPWPPPPAPSSWFRRIPSLLPPGPCRGFRPLSPAPLPVPLTPASFPCPCPRPWLCPRQLPAPWPAPCAPLLLALVPCPCPCVSPLSAAAGARVLPVPLPVPCAVPCVPPSAARALACPVYLSSPAAAGPGGLPVSLPSVLAVCALVCPPRPSFGAPTVAFRPSPRVPAAGTLPRSFAVPPLLDHAPGVSLPLHLRQRDAWRRTLWRRGRTAAAFPRGRRSWAFTACGGWCGCGWA